MKKETIDRYAEKLANICAKEGIDPESLTLIQLREMTNQVVRQDVYAFCPTFNPYALEALIAFSDSLDDCLKELLGIDPTIPFIEQCESLEPELKQTGELLNDLARRALAMALKRLTGT